SRDVQAELQPPLLTSRCRALPQDPTPAAPYRGPASAHHTAHGIKAPLAAATAAARPRLAHTGAPATRSRPAKAPPTADRSGCDRQPQAQPHAAQAPPAHQTNVAPDRGPPPHSQAPSPSAGPNSAATHSQARCSARHVAAL